MASGYILSGIMFSAMVTLQTRVPTILLCNGLHGTTYQRRISTRRYTGIKNEIGQGKDRIHSDTGSEYSGRDHLNRRNIGRVFSSDWLPVYRVGKKGGGNAAGIGVMPLSVTAAMLEIAAQNGDRATNWVHHYRFIQDTRKVAESVAEVLSAKNEKMDATEISVGNKDWLHEELKQLQSAIIEKKMQQIDLIMEELR